MVLWIYVVNLTFVVKLIHAQANIPTKETTAQPRTWFYEAYGEPGRAQSFESAAPKGPQKTNALELSLDPKP